MELLLINYLEEQKKYNDVEILDYSLDGVNCEVSFTHIGSTLYDTIEKLICGMYYLILIINYKNKLL